jgi:hypothetical protein
MGINAIVLLFGLLGKIIGGSLRNWSMYWDYLGIGYFIVHEYYRVVSYCFDCR